MSLTGVYSMIAFLSAYSLTMYHVVHTIYSYMFNIAQSTECRLDGIRMVAMQGRL